MKDYIMNQPEKLNLWDRIFNRRQRVVHDRGSETWQGRSQITHEMVRYQRDYVEYRIIDRLTGSERIEREYLN